MGRRTLANRPESPVIRSLLRPRSFLTGAAPVKYSRRLACVRAAMSKKHPHHQPKPSVAKVAGGALAIAGATAPFWVEGSAGSPISGLMEVRNGTPIGTALNDAANKLRSNLPSSAVTAVVLVGTGAALVKITSYAKRHGWIPRGMGV